MNKVFTEKENEIGLESQMENKSWIVTIETDPETGDLILPLNDDILKETNWQIGDTIQWDDNQDGTWTMKKKIDNEKTQWVLVETVQLFRQRYMVEVPINQEEYALDTVLMQEAIEFSQKRLDEIIISHRVVTEEDAMTMCDQDNNYCSNWNDEKKKEVFFTEWRKDEESN